MSLCHRTQRRNQLPDGFVSIRDLLDGKRALGTTVSIIGAVTDFRTPIATRGKDWKCQIRLYDYSMKEVNEDSILFNVFRPEDEMPDAGLCDVVVILQAKVQKHLHAMSLITNHTTDIHIYSASKIPKPPQEASRALKPSSRKTTCDPNKLVHEYVSFFYHSIDKAKAPTESEFEVMKLKSANVAQKFSELRNVRDGIFVDAVVQIVKQPYESGDKFTMWVSDYTENDKFYKFAFKGIDAIDAQDGDERYLASLYNSTGSGADWTGPFGQRSMQITCFEPHASFIRDRNLSAGSWVVLRNLQIKYGHNDANLEGFLREDRGAAGIKINIICLDPTDTETPDPRLKEAIRRKRDYERAKKDQLKGISEAAKASKKRKSDMNSKQKRQAKRAAKQAGYNEAQQTAVVNLNSQVRCENENKAASTVEDMIKPACLQTTVNGQEVKLELPFTNVNYRTNVRVVNFMPSNLEDFSCPQKKSGEYDMLSDNDESDSGSESEQDMMTDFTTVREWGWRFFLELEDATPAAEDKGQKKKTVWVVVDNLAAQCLMDLDASDLRRNHKDLEALRQRLFLLWGELEEHKSREAAKKGRVAHAAAQDGPPLHSSDDEGKAQKQEGEQVNNRPFSCCLRQYGVKVPESDPCKADAGSGKRWQRMFGLFGTRIAS